LRIIVVLMSVLAVNQLIVLHCIYFRRICCTCRQRELCCFGPQIWSRHGLWRRRQEGEHVGHWKADMYIGKWPSSVTQSNESNLRHWNIDAELVSIG